MKELIPIRYLDKYEGYLKIKIIDIDITFKKILLVEN